MSSSLKSGLIPAYRRLLAPLVRILLRNGVSFDEFSELAKTVFVDVALGDSKDSSIVDVESAVGISRKEIERIKSLGETDFELGGNLARVTRLLSGWHTDNDFTGPYGLPLELPYEHPTQPDFKKLVTRYSDQNEPDNLLRELSRIGVLKETESNWFKVLTRTYLPKTDALDSIERLGDVIGNFVETIDHNSRETDPNKKLFERIAVADDGIRPEDVPLFNEYVKDRAQLFLEEIDNWLSQLDPPSDEDISGKGINTGVGIYHYVENDLQK